MGDGCSLGRERQHLYENRFFGIRVRVGIRRERLAIGNRWRDFLRAADASWSRGVLGGISKSLQVSAQSARSAE